RINGLAKDHTTGTLYATSDGGIVWKKTPPESDWEALNDRYPFTPIRDIFIIPTTDSTTYSTNDIQHRLFVVTRSSLYYSDSEGALWSTATGIPEGASIKTCIYLEKSDTSLWCLAGYDGGSILISSNDNGTTFNQVLQSATQSSYSDIWGDRYGDGSTLYFLEDQSLFEIETATGSKHHKGTMYGAQGSTRLKGSGATNPVTLAVLKRYDLYRSDNGGTDWNHVSNVADYQNYGIFSFGLSQTDPDLFMVGDMEFAKSYTAGSSWEFHNKWYEYKDSPEDKIHADIRNIVTLVDPMGNETLYLCNDGGIMISTDNAESMSNITLNGIRVSQAYGMYVQENTESTIHIGTQDQGWIEITSTIDEVGIGTKQSTGDVGHFISTDSGKTVWWTYTDGGVIAYQNGEYIGRGNLGGNKLWIIPLMASPDSPEEVYLAGGSSQGSSGSYLVKGTIANGSVQLHDLPYNFSNASEGGKLTAIDYSTIDPNHWYAATYTNEKSYFFHSSNKGASWTPYNLSNIHAQATYLTGTDILPSTKELGTVYLAGSGYSNPGVFKISDHGSSITPITEGLPNTVIFGLAFNNDESLMFAATKAGPYVYVFETEQWYELHDDKAPDQTYMAVKYNAHENAVFFGTYGRGVWKFKLIDTPLQQVTIQNGSIQGLETNSASGLFEQGDTLTIVADSSEEGMYFTGWEVSPALHLDSISSTSTIIVPDFDLTLTANYDSIVIVESSSSEPSSDTYSSSSSLLSSAEYESSDTESSEAEMSSDEPVPLHQLDPQFSLRFHDGYITVINKSFTARPLILYTLNGAEVTRTLIPAQSDQYTIALKELYPNLVSGIYVVALQQSSVRTIISVR
ncbi:MAG: hypothetical protein OCC49_18885, partial [Fibrobacterales bacterium]